MSSSKKRMLVFFRYVRTDRQNCVMSEWHECENGPLGTIKTVRSALRKIDWQDLPISLYVEAYDDRIQYAGVFVVRKVSSLCVVSATVNFGVEFREPVREVS